MTQSAPATFDSFAGNDLPSGGGGGGGVGLGGRRAGGKTGAAPSLKKQNSALPVRVAGKFTAYLKGNILFASNATDVDPEKDASKITVITKFSPEYFELIQTTTAAENQLLALQEPNEEMIVRIQGKLYRLK